MCRLVQLNSIGTGTYSRRTTIKDVSSVYQCLLASQAGKAQQLHSQDLLQWACSRPTELEVQFCQKGSFFVVVRALNWALEECEPLEVEVSWTGFLHLSWEPSCRGLVCAR